MESHTTHYYSNHLHQVWCRLRLANVRCNMRPILQIDADLQVMCNEHKQKAQFTYYLQFTPLSIYQHSIQTEIDTS